MGYYSYGYYDPYLILMIPALLLSLWAQFRVKSTFSKYSAARTGMTGAEAAQKVLEKNGVYDVRIEHVNGNLTDHYDPKTNTIRLSDAVYGTASVAAMGVAAHEAGHAVQYAVGYGPIRARAAILPVSQLASQLSLPLLMLGIIFSFSLLTEIGILLFCGALLFHLITLPVEFNASSRALRTLRENNLVHSDDEYRGASRVLRAAAMTYVASFLVSLMQLVRLIALSNRRRR